MNHEPSHPPPHPPSHPSSHLAVAANSPADPDAIVEQAYQAHVRGDWEEADRAYRTVLAIQPDIAPCWSNLGLVLRARAKPDEAELAARTALRLSPDFADAHNSLGMAQHDLNRLAEAENSFRGALRLRPDLAAAWINLGLVRQKFGALAEAEACYRTALRYGADFGQVGGNLGLVLLEQGRIVEAEAACRNALHQRPDNAEARVNLATVLLLTSRFHEAWPAYEARSAFTPDPIPDPSIARWTGQEDIAGRTILLRAEQGLGDTLQFCRYALLLVDQGARVVLEVQQPLVRLLSSLRGVAAVIGIGDTRPHVDLWCSIMSLPYLCGTTLDTIPCCIPYLSPAPSARAAWADRLAGLTGLRVGLVWGGGTRPDQPHAMAIDRRRSMTLTDMAPLGDIQPCHFISLQIGDKASQASRPPDGLKLLDPTAMLGDFADTAALVANLDLVIAVDTSVAHLAGAIGTPVWLLNRFDTCWRWLLDRDDSPWYPGLRQFRQDRPGDWAGVIGRVRQALEAVVAAR